MHRSITRRLPGTASTKGKSKQVVGSGKGRGTEELEGWIETCDGI